MGTDIRNYDSVELMLDALLNQALDTKHGISCFNCFIDQKSFIIAMDLSDKDYCVIFIYNTESDQYLIINERYDWHDVDKKIYAFLGSSAQEVDKKVSVFLGYSDQSVLNVTANAVYWQENLLPYNDFVTEAIKLKRKFFISSYYDIFDDHYAQWDEISRLVLLITKFSDDFKQVHFYVHFVGTNLAFHLSEKTDTPYIMRNLYYEYCDYEEKLQIREREEANKFLSKDKYSSSDFNLIKLRFLNAISSAFESDNGIYSFRFQTNNGDYAVEIIAVSSDLYEVTVIVYDINTNNIFSRQVSNRSFFDNNFTVDLFKELFPEEAHALYKEKIFDPKIREIKKQITDILDKARQGSPSSCSFYAVNKDMPDLTEKYSADAFAEQNSNCLRLTVESPYSGEPSYVETVKSGESYDGIFNKLYSFLYPNKISLSKEDIF